MNQRKTKEEVLIEDDCHSLSKLFMKDIKKYLEMGGSPKFMTFDSVYRTIDPKKELRDEEPSNYQTLGVRGEDMNESRI